MTAPFLSLIDRFADARIVVVGDAMLDVYSAGTSTRLSPEAPVPVILMAETRSALGGAANVAANIAALGAPVSFICLTGDDAVRNDLIACAASAGIGTTGFIADATRPTTVKERIVMNGAPFARIDRERTHDVSGAARDAMMTQYKEALGQAGAVILSDYCKGALPDEVVREMMALAESKNIPVLADSKKKDWSCFAGALLAKPNVRELRERAGDGGSLEEAARRLLKQSGMKAMLLSRSEDGVMLVSPDTVFSCAATARHVAEVSGAGDTLLSVCGLALASGASPREAACLGNIAAGIAVEKSGTATIGKEELRDGVLRYLASERQSA